MLLLLFLAALAAGLPGSPGTDAPPDLPPILEGARQVQVADTAAWGRFRFRRESLREELDDSGKVTSSETLVLEIAPVPGGFDEELVEIDGRKPTRREVEAHRDAGRFGKHYRTFLEGEAGGEGGGRSYSLGDLFRMSSYRYAGQETVEGIRCHRLEFSPDPGRGNPGVAGKFADAMAGTLWITVEGLHLFRARAGTVKPVSFALSLIKIHGVRLEMESAAVEEGTWLPRRILVETRSRFLLKTSRRRTLFRYDRFLPAGQAEGR